PLLTSDWATRQTTLAKMQANGTLWSTFGATQGAYDGLHAYLSNQNLILLGDATGSDGYVSSAQSRTIWATMTADQFKSVFGTALRQGEPNGGFYYWNGNLTLPDGAGIAGVWFDSAPWYGPSPAESNLAGTASVIPPQGPLSIGNALAPGVAQSKFLEQNAYSGHIAKWFYQCPLAGLDVPTTTVGLLEPLVGDAVESGYSFQAGLDSFRTGAGLSTPGRYFVLANGGESASGDIGERSLDVGVVSSA